MKPEGFKVEVKLDLKTGFIFGGNAFNCGTWMDKLGSSEKAKNRGIPATPRDGANVEIVGLLKSAVRFLSELYEKGVYPHEGVAIEGGTLTYKEWNALIESNFEKHFYHPYDHQRGIYKDTVFCKSNPSTESQLRCNFPIAMVVAPEMFTIKEHAVSALKEAERALWEPGSLGMKTLDPGDRNYRGEYNNKDDTSDYTRAHGFSYHQGPEWVWPLGYFLRAILKFYNFSDSDSLKTCIMGKLLEHQLVIKSNGWRSIPELTNEKGKFCADSCPAQAWSVGCLIEAIQDYYEVLKKVKIE